MRSYIIRSLRRRRRLKKTVLERGGFWRSLVEIDAPNGDAQEIGGYAGVGVANGDDTEDAGAEEEQGKEEKPVFAAEVEKTAE